MGVAELTLITLIVVVPVVVITLAIRLARGGRRWR
jgi:hypothetical protein